MSSLVPWQDATARLGEASLGVPIQFENTDFTPPPGLWLSVQMTSDVLEPMDLGANAWVEIGVLWVHVWAPAGSGSEAARALAKGVANIFRAVPAGTGPVIYLNASIGGRMVDPPDGISWGLAVTIDWKYEDITT